MIHRVAENKMLVQYDPGSIDYVTDPIPLGSFDQITIHLLIQHLDTPATVGNAQVRMRPQVANVPASGWIDLPGWVEGTASSTTPIALTTLVNGAFVRFKFTLTISAGEVGLFRAIFTSLVMFMKA